jgi:hypothetical protein
MAKKQKTHEGKEKKSQAQPVNGIWPASTPKPKEVKFIYIKSNGHRVLHIDGAQAAPATSPKNIQMAFFSERFPIPQEETYDVDSSDNLSTIRETAGRKGIIRQVVTCPQSLYQAL